MQNTEKDLEQAAGAQPDSVEREPKTVLYELWRFQLLPTPRAQQRLPFGEEQLTQEDLLQRKNQIFQNSLLSLSEDLEHGGRPMRTQSFSVDDKIAIRLSRRRALPRHRQDFTIEEVPDWPSVMLLVDNDPETQVIASSNNPPAFGSPQMAVKVLVDQLRPSLREYGLSVQVHPLQEKSEFWSFVRAHRGEVTRLDFELVPPNMSSLSKHLPEELRSLQRETGNTTTNIVLKAPEGEALHLEETGTVKALNDYCADGGGIVKMKARGSRTQTTGKTRKRVELDFEYEGTEAALNEALDKIGDVLG